MSSRLYMVLIFMLVPWPLAGHVVERYHLQVRRQEKREKKLQYAARVWTPIVEGDEETTY